MPNLPDSIDVMDMMTVWFGEQAEEAKKEGNYAIIKNGSGYSGQYYQDKYIF